VDLAHFFIAAKLIVVARSISQQFVVAMINILCFTSRHWSPKKINRDQFDNNGFFITTDFL
jgi:hypothetical protein